MQWIFAAFCELTPIRSVRVTISSEQSLRLRRQRGSIIISGCSTPAGRAAFLSSNIVREQAYDSSLDPKGAEMDIIARLQAAKDKTLKYFDLPEEQLALRYAPDKWPVRFILHHLADAETVLFDRIRRIISEPRQVLWAFDQDAWAIGLDYSRIPVDLSRRIYESVRAGVIYQARLHYEKSGHLEFTHSETGVRTLKAEFDKVASHNEHHLEQIDLALENPAS